MTIHPDESMTVKDNGSGIPVDMMKDQGLPALTVVLTKLHAGGKFGQGGYKVSGGLHGVGVSVVNALSEWLVAEVQRDGKTWRQEFARGEPTTAAKLVGPTKDCPDADRASSPTPRSSRRPSDCRVARPAPARDGVLTMGLNRAL